MARETVAEQLRSNVAALTRSERQLSDIILKNYPVSGLGTITTLAEAADVSTPTVARLVQKLGFKGFAEFQQALRRELDETISSPLTKREKWVDDAPDGHILNRFTKSVIENIGQTLGEVDPAQFDLACNLVSDPGRRVFVVGGRITRTLADYFFLHLQVIREQVTHVASNSNAWPHYILDVNADDVIVIFDIRRYENSTLRLAEMASEREAKIILFTDQWTSPVAPLADLTFRNHISVPSAWDSNVTGMLLTEILLAHVQEHDWENTRTRMEALEDMFDRTRFFRKF
ncbi:RpiR family transcriptional regulator [Chromatiales bacterium (ex Bugula neritina AB1)]|nr:RpiR family transcriptional regulator [Chromatiales bacterium (ex Bugula neritina AB1)]